MFPVWIFLAANVATLPLTLPFGSLFTAATGALLLLCTIALWFERDRSSARPNHFDNGDMRLAA